MSTFTLKTGVCLMVFALVLLFGPGSLSAAFLTQTFDTEQSARDGGWDAVNPRGSYQEVGLANSTYAGGTAWEANFTVGRSEKTYYADINNVGSISFGQPFQASYKLALEDRADPTGNGRWLGYFVSVAETNPRRFDAIGLDKK